MGFLFWKEVDGLKIADIIYEGNTIGNAYYIDDYRQFIINQILID